MTLVENEHALIQMKEEQEQLPKKVTDIDAVRDNTDMAVEAFAERWAPMPKFSIGVEVMDARQLRDAMGLRSSMDWGDPWPQAEQRLLQMGFRWHWLGQSRVMFLQERDEFIRSGGNTGWEEAVELDGKAAVVQQHTGRR